MSGRRDSSTNWDSPAPNSLECWDYSIELECLQGPEDLQLAAELGKTLLERNRELENSLKQHQNIIEDQTQEIEYLTKQTAALREVNDSRLRIYEQLEVSIQELERANQRLAVDNSADKKHIKSLCLSIDSLESRCEELQRALDEVTLQQSSQLRRQQRSKGPQSSSSSDNKNSSDHSIKLENEADQHGDEGVDMKENAEDEEVIRLLEQLQESRSLRAKEQRKIAELEEQLAGLLQENLALEEQLTLLQQKEEDMKSLQEEISTLEEVRQGHLCGRCLRNVDSRGHDELSMMLDHEEEEEDASVANSVVSETHRSMVMLQIQDPSVEVVQTHDNPYRVLVEKYEALLEMQRHPTLARQHHVAPSTNCLSLQEELQLSGDFSSFNGKVDADAESDNEGTEPAVAGKSCKKESSTQKKAEKAFSATPTDFSEAETSSSGFSDEISNKATQTEGHLPPGSFLCSIADGDDCRFSIYDDASPIESRFRKTPEYRQLFREIFAVLKRAAEAKDEGEQLPLLEDLTPVPEAPKVPPVTPSKEDLPDDIHKRNSGNSTHSANPELPNKSTNTEDIDGNVTKKEMIPDKESHPPVKNTTVGCNSQDSNDSLAKETDLPQPKAAPKQDILEYLSVGVGVRKKSHGRKNSPMKTLKPTVAERVEQIESIPSASSCTGVTYVNRVSNSGRRRREIKNSDKGRGGYNQSPIRGESSMPFQAWKKRDIQNSSYSQQKPSYFQQSSYQGLGHQQQSTWDFQPFISSASQEVAKLKRLEKSYAEVLRLGPQKCSNRPIPTNNYRK